MPTVTQTRYKEVRHARVREVMKGEGFDAILAFSNAKLRTDVEYLHRWDSMNSSGPPR